MSNPKIITSAPYFQVCKKCGKHGRIVIPALSQHSEEILTQADGVVSSEYALEDGLIKVDEFPELKRQVKTSTIPEMEPDINVIFCAEYIAIRYEEVKDEVGPLDEGDNTHAPANVTLH